MREGGANGEEEEGSGAGGGAVEGTREMGLAWAELGGGETKGGSGGARLGWTYV